MDAQDPRNKKRKRGGNDNEKDGNEDTRTVDISAMQNQRGSKTKGQSGNGGKTGKGRGR